MKRNRAPRAWGLGLAEVPRAMAILDPRPVELAWLADAILALVDPLYDFARHLTGNDADAEDLVQEAIARALAAGNRFTEGTNLQAWLYRILRNVFLDRMRRVRREPTRADVDETGKAGEPHPTCDLEPGGFRHVVAQEIERALQTLSDDARAVVLMDLEGFSHAEMAKVLDCAPNTIKSRLSRARSALRDKLKDYAR